MTFMKTQQAENKEKFKSAPLKESAAEMLDEIIRLTGVQKYRLLQRLIETELKRLQASMSSQPQEVS